MLARSKARPRLERQSKASRMAVREEEEEEKVRKGKFISSGII